MFNDVSTLPAVVTIDLSVCDIVSVWVLVESSVALGTLSHTFLVLPLLFLFDALKNAFDSMVDLSLGFETNVLFFLYQ